MAATTTGKKRTGRATTRSRRTASAGGGPKLPMASGEEISLSGRGAEVVILDPPTAKLWLESQKRNRSIKERKVDQFADAIRRGEWTYNGQACAFDRGGHLLDGQHRCLAVIRAGKSIPTLVTWGIDADAQDTMDVGSARSFADALSMRGVKSASEVASVIRHLYFFRRYERIGVRGEVPTIVQLHPIHDEFADRAEEAVKIGSAIKRAGIRVPTSVTGLLYILFSQVDKDDADVFFDRLRTGLELSEDDPIYALRRLILKQMTKQYQIDVAHIAALIIKAFNKWRRGESATLLSWRPGGATPEPFPKIDGLEGI